MPTCTARARASGTRAASSPVRMPPSPTTGMRTARASACTIASATGLIAGPESPPVTLAQPRPARRRVDRHAAQRVDRAQRVGALAPPPRARPPSMSVTFGESFTQSGSCTRGRTGAHDARQRRRIGREDAAPLRAVRARGVQLERDDPGRAVEPRRRTPRTPPALSPQKFATTRAPRRVQRAAAARAGRRRRRCSAARSRSACRPASRRAAAAVLPAYGASESPFTADRADRRQVDQAGELGAVAEACRTPRSPASAAVTAPTVTARSTRVRHAHRSRQQRSSMTIASCPGP